MMYSEEFEYSLALVKKCGDVIKSAFHAEKKISEKSAPNDLVTDTDQLVEKMLIEGLREKYPDSMYMILLSREDHHSYACQVHRRGERGGRREM